MMNLAQTGKGDTSTSSAPALGASASNASVSNAPTSSKSTSSVLPPGASPHLFDMHCHLSFAPEMRAAARAARAQGIGAFSTTVTPTDYDRAVCELGVCDAVRVGVGLHPWWVADGTCGVDAMEAFEHFAAQTRYIGEIGLDFAPRHVQAREVQQAFFERAIAACADGGNVLSIHAVRAATQVLDVLERAQATAQNACILHWFSGTSDELQRAMRLGCYFSVNARMLESKRGRAYVQAIPAGQLLLETDEPAEEGMPYDAAALVARLEGVLDTLAHLRCVDRVELAERIAATSAHLLCVEDCTMN